MSTNRLKKCSVLHCDSSTVTNKDLKFVYVPAGGMKRKLWLERIQPATIERHMYCCQLHFDIEVDSAGFEKFIAQNKKFPQYLVLKRDVLPHKNLPEPMAGTVRKRVEETVDCGAEDFDDEAIMKEKGFSAILAKPSHNVLAEHVMVGIIEDTVVKEEPQLAEQCVESGVHNTPIKYADDQPTGLNICITCDMVFENESALTAHCATSKHLLVSGTKDKSLGDKKREKNLNLLVSRRGGKKRDKPTCNVCDMSFTHSKEIVTHFKEVHPQIWLKTYPCQHCDEVFFLRQSFLYHSTTHMNQFKCKQCGMQHGARIELENHIKHFHTARIEPPSFATEMSKEVNLFMQTEEVNTIDRTETVDIQKVSNESECNICQAKFANVKKVVSHCKEAHPEANLKTYNCCYCDEVFLLPQALLAHLFGHKDKYKCNQCGKRNSSNNDLRMHHMTQHRQQPVTDQAETILPGNRRSPVRAVMPTCSVCQATFKHSKEVVAHFEEAHPGTELKSYPCSECDEVFFVNDLLVLHSNIHKVMYKCAKCGKQYSSKEKLEWHEENEHAEDVLVKQRCDDGQNTTTSNICNASFEHSKDVVTHFTDIHPEAKLTSFPCSECEEVFFSNSSLVTHFAEVHPNTNMITDSGNVGIMHECCHCGNQFKLRRHLKMHKKFNKACSQNRTEVRRKKKNQLVTARRGGVHQCNVCDESFEDSKQVVTHFKEVHPNAELPLYPCSQCEAVFFFNRALLTHTKIHNRYKCEYCAKPHASRADLKRHEQSHLTENELLASRRGGVDRNEPTCNICATTFGHSKEVVIHFKEVHPEKELIFFPCKECDEVFFDRKFYQYHANIHTDLFKCSQCGKRTGSKAGLLSHERGHQKRESNIDRNRNPLANRIPTNQPQIAAATCKVCHETFEHSKEIVTHFKKVHPEAELKYFSCKECEEVFFVYRMFVYHSRLHTDRFRCRYCGKRHGSSYKLKCHEIIHRKNARLDRKARLAMCNICHTSFEQSEGIIAHYKDVHPGIKLQNYTCRECDEVYFSHKSLQCHSVIHTDMYKCTHCGKRHSTKFGLKRHLKIHETREPVHTSEQTKYIEVVNCKNTNKQLIAFRRGGVHQCNVCDESFNDSKQVITHFKEVHPNIELPLYPCNQCKRVFFFNRSLLAHSRIHNRYKCQHCAKLHVSRADLRRHEQCHFTQNKPLASRRGGINRNEPTCNICATTFGHSKEVAIHFKEVHPEKELIFFPCKECDEVFFARKFYQYHVNLHTDLFKCSQCGRRTGSKAGLMTHERIHQKRPNKDRTDRNKNPLAIRRSTNHPQSAAAICKVCHETFEHSKEVVTHFKKAHPETKFKYFPCKECEEVFFIYRMYVYHSSLHTDRYKCRYCGKRHGAAANLKFHEIMHKKNDRLNRKSHRAMLKCNICHISFEQSDGIIAHYKNVHPRTKLKRYPCRECDKVYLSHKSLQCHSVIHTDMYKCTHCGKRHSTKYCLKRHLKIHETREPVHTSEQTKDIEVSAETYLSAQPVDVTEIYPTSFHDAIETDAYTIVKEEAGFNDSEILQDVIISEPLNDTDNLLQDIVKKAAQEILQERSYIECCENNIVQEELLPADPKLPQDVTDHHTQDTVETLQNADVHSNPQESSAFETDANTIDETCIKEPQQTEISIESKAKNTQKNEYVCLTCDIVFKTKAYLMVHEQTIKHQKATQRKAPRIGELASRRGGDRNLPTCNVCQTSFEHSKEVVTHFKEVHPEMALKSYPCSKCEEVFFVHRSLLYHSHVHAGKNKCDECEKCYASNHDLEMQRKIHQSHQKIANSEAAKENKVMIPAEAATSSVNVTTTHSPNIHDGSETDANKIIEKGPCLVDSEPVGQLDSTEPPHDTKYLRDIVDQATKEIKQERLTIEHSENTTLNEELPLSESKMLQDIAEKHVQDMLETVCNNAENRTHQQKGIDTDNDTIAAEENTLFVLELPQRDDVCSLEQRQQECDGFKQVESMIVKEESQLAEVCIVKDVPNTHSNEHVCLTCDIVFKTKANLMVHEQTTKHMMTLQIKSSNVEGLLASRKGGIRNLPTCNVCETSFEQSKEVVTHFEEVHPEMALKFYPCSECEEVFFINRSLLYHSHVHAGKNKCYQCDNHFASKIDLEVHRKVHQTHRNKSHSKSAKESMIKNRITATTDTPDDMITNHSANISNAKRVDDNSIGTEESSLPVSDALHQPNIIEKSDANCLQVLVDETAHALLLERSTMPNGEDKIVNLVDMAAQELLIENFTIKNEKDTIEQPLSIDSQRLQEADVPEQQETHFSIEYVHSLQNLQQRTTIKYSEQTIVNEFSPLTDLQLQQQEEIITEQQYEQDTAKNLQDLIVNAADLVNPQIKSGDYAVDKHDLQEIFKIQNVNCTIVKEELVDLEQMEESNEHEQVSYTNENVEYIDSAENQTHLSDSSTIETEGATEKLADLGLPQQNEFSGLEKRQTELNVNENFEDVIIKEEPQLVESQRHGYVNGKWVCSVCYKSYSTKFTMLRHARETHNLKKPKPRKREKHGCSFCSLTFKHSLGLLNHIETQHNDVSSKRKLREVKQKIKEDIAQNNSGTEAQSAESSDGSDEEEQTNPYHCSTCNITLKNQHNLNLHLKTMRHKKASNKTILVTTTGGQNKKVKCNVCHATFKHSKDIVTHFKEAHPETKLKKYPCRKCDEVFFGAISLRSHASVHTDTYKCEDCGKKNWSKQCLVRHRALVHNIPLLQETIEYPICEREVRSDLYKGHMRYHNKTKVPMDELNLERRTAPKIFKCVPCNKSFRSMNALKTHEQRLTHKNAAAQQILATRYGGNKKNTPTCNLCQATFQYSKEIGAHFSEYHPERELISYECRKCDEVFFRRVELQRHGRVHLRKYTCGECQKGHIGQRALNVHMHRVHGAPYELVKCGLCNRDVKDYMYKSHLQDHKSRPRRLIKKEPKTYTCAHCDKVFKSRGEQRNHEQTIKHIETVRNEKSLASRNGGRDVSTTTCNLCQMNFPQSKEIINHFREVHPDRELEVYPCGECEDVYFTVQSFRNHSFIHTDRYACNQCHKRHTSNKTLRIHTHNEHGVPFKLVKCTICERDVKDYLYTTHLRNHEKRASGWKPIRKKMPKKVRVYPKKKLREKKPKEHQCTTCSMTFVHKLGLQNHIADQHDPIHSQETSGGVKRKRQEVVNDDETSREIHDCLACHLTFSSRCSLQKHNKSVMHQEIAFNKRPLAMRSRCKSEIITTCNVCQATFQKSKNIVTHFEMTHPERKLVYHSCNECDEVFFLMPSLKTHSNLHTDRFACNQCGKRHTTKRDQDNHRCPHVAIEKIECPACKQLCSVGRGIKLHLRTRHRDDYARLEKIVNEHETAKRKSQISKPCGESEGQRETPRIAKKRTNKGKIKCYTCQKMFLSREALKRHQKDSKHPVKGKSYERALVTRSTGAYGLKCTLCRRKFQQSTQVVTHFKDAHPETELRCYPCSKCEEILFTQKLLYQHCALHTDRHVCDQCGKRHKTKKCLHIHMHIIHGAQCKTIKCPICDREIKDYIYNTHVRHHKLQRNNEAKTTGQNIVTINEEEPSLSDLKLTQEISRSQHDQN